MRIAYSISFLLLTACGPKTPPVATADAPTETVETVETETKEGEAEEGEAETIGIPTPTDNAPVELVPDALIPDDEAPTPDLAPRKPDNADLNVTLTFADGTTKKGHVRRVEVSKDWYGETEWSDATGRLTITLEAAGSETELTWADLSSVRIVPKSVSKDASCTYDSGYTPWMYTCELATTATARAKDGRRFAVADHHKWRFVFDDDTQQEFWIYKLPARQQDEGGVEFGLDHGENYAIYGNLQQQLRSDVRTMVKSIRIQ